MRKKLLALGLIVAMVCTAFIGCGSAKGNETGGAAKGTELQIGILAKGYGSEFVHELAKAFETKTGIKTKVVRDDASGSWIDGAMVGGPSINEVDVIFDIRDTLMNSVATAYQVDGYERHIADLSDIYASVPEGYDTEKTVAELFDPYLLRASTWDLEGEGYGDGKQYFVSYAAGLEGLIYNEDLFNKYNLELPRTSEEFFAVMDQMKGLNAKNDEGRTIYPFCYANGNYMNFLARAWWAQYDTVDGYNRTMEGKDASGNYTPESAKSAGKLSALQKIADIINMDGGYVSSNDFAQSFTDAQVKFLDNQAFMMVTGEWVEREMAGNFGDKQMNIKFMRIPVNSDITLVCDSVKTEEQLVEVIDYIA